MPPPRLSKFLRNHRPQSDKASPFGTILAVSTGMHYSDFNSVSFVGGPFDGCVFARRGTSELCRQIGMPISRNILRLLSGEPAGDEQTIRSVATYRLVATAYGPRYLFHCSERVDAGESKELAVWHHALLAAWNKVLGH